MDSRTIEINLSKNRKTIIDKKDEFVTKYKWYFDGRYAARNATVAETKKGIRCKVYLHRQILNFPKFKVDHKDRDKLNNRRNNFRVANRNENAANTSKRNIKSTSKYKGVSFSKEKNKWNAQIMCQGASFRKRFDKEIDAAIWYNEKAILLFGEFAYVNKIK